jgi:hypothetical protein
MMKKQNGHGQECTVAAVIRITERSTGALRQGKAHTTVNGGSQMRDNLI